MGEPLSGSNSNKVWRYITEGKVRQRADETTEGAAPRIVTNPKTGENKTVYELVYDYVEGYITKIEMYKDDFNTELIETTIYNQDDDQYRVLKIKLNSGYGSKFFELIPNVNMKEPVRIFPYSFTNKEKKVIIGLNIYQPKDTLDLKFEKKIEKKWTKENPGDVPSFDPDDIDQWKLDIKKFHKNYLTKNVIPNVLERPWEEDGKELFPNGEDIPEEKSAKEKALEQKIDDDVEDDLPF